MRERVGCISFPPSPLPAERGHAAYPASPPPSFPQDVAVQLILLHPPPPSPQDVAVQRDLRTINDLLDTSKSSKGRGYGDCWPAPLQSKEKAKAIRKASARAIGEPGGGYTVTLRM